MKTQKKLEQIEKQLRTIALDLQQGAEKNDRVADVAHEAEKIKKIADDLRQILVRGGGTGSE